MTTSNRRETGNIYEDVAADYLKRNGYSIIERNHRNKCGEIDIIAMSPDNYLVFTEVKYRSSERYGDALEAVGFTKQKRICRAAGYFLTSHQAAYGSMGIRFDVIGIYSDARLRHVENAFEYIG